MLSAFEWTLTMTWNEGHICTYNSCVEHKDNGAKLAPSRYGIGQETRHREREPKQ
jgi:hypothetical protein